MAAEAEAEAALISFRLRLCLLDDEGDVDVEDTCRTGGGGGGGGGGGVAANVSTIPGKFKVSLDLSSGRLFVSTTSHKYLSAAMAASISLAKVPTYLRSLVMGW